MNDGGAGPPGGLPPPGPPPDPWGPPPNIWSAPESAAWPVDRATWPADWLRPVHQRTRPPRRRAVKRWWVFWQSPDDQPRWARPTLLAVTALAALAYSWGLDHASLEPFYGAAARSMSMSWHDFIFGAFDPAGTVTVDKLPGALWLQALSLRAFGVNTWTFVMPQVIEGILTVLVLYRAVRRLAGPLAGIVAALVLAASPVTVLLNRGNISDSLLILLLVLAADATSLAIRTGRLRTLLAAGVWVGLAFQAKMTQAWLVLPALWLAYLIASPARGKRMGHVVAATAVTAVVSLSWMLAVTAVPGHDRPYVDGSRNDSEFAQVFDYNGYSRFEHPSAYETAVGPLAPFLVVSLETRTFLNSSTASVGRSWHRLLSGLLGRDTAWLVPAALLSAVAVSVGRRRRRRSDPVRACCVLWGTWLLVHLVAFSDGAYLNSYYTAALSPAIAALCGVGLSAAWRALRAGTPRDLVARDPLVPFDTVRGGDRVALDATAPFDEAADNDEPVSSGRAGRVLVGTAVSATAAYAVYLIPGGTGVRPWLVPAVIAAAVVADLALIIWSTRGRATARTAPAVLLIAASAMLLVPAVASATVVTDGLGPFDTPFEPASVSAVTQTDARRALHEAAVESRTLENLARAAGARMLFVTDSSAVASAYILASGREVLPIGGFTGAIPSPTLGQIRADIAFGAVRLAVVPVVPPGDDPRIVWIRTHCRLARLDAPATVRFGVYDCHDAAGA